MIIQFTTNLDICKQDVWLVSNHAYGAWTHVPQLHSTIQLPGYELEVVRIKYRPPSKTNGNWSCEVSLHIPKWFPYGVDKWETVVINARKHANV